MTNKPEPTGAEVRKRLKEFRRKHRAKCPVPPVDKNEPEGLLAGDPGRVKERTEEEFNDEYGEEKPKCKLVKKKDDKSETNGANKWGQIYFSLRLTLRADRTPQGLIKSQPRWVSD